MPQTCKACTSPKRKEIDKALALGGTLRDIARRFGISRSGLSRHKRDHIQPLVKTVAAQHQQAILKVAEQRAAEDRLTGEMVLDELRLHGFYDPGEFFNEKGALKDINEMTPRARAVIKAFDFVNLYEGNGGQQHCFGQMRKIRTSDKLKALALLGQHFGLFPTSPPPVQQNNFQVNILLRSDAELEHFIAYGEWPSNGSADPRRIGSSSTERGGGSTPTQT